MKRLCGTVVPVITPLTGVGAIDEESLARLLEHVIRSGVQGIFPCGTTGEMMYLSVEERKRIAEITVQAAHGRIPVFIQTGAWNLKDTIALSRHAEEIGADGIGVVTPAFYKLSDAALLDFYVTVAHNVSEDFPVYLYAIPQNAVNDLTPSVCEEIAKRCPNVVGVKYSYPDISRMQKLMLVNGGNFSVLTGPDHLFTAVCAIGGDGVVSGNANVIGAHYAAIWEEIRKKNFEQAMVYQRRTNVLNDILCEVNAIAAFKVMLREEGVIRASAVRRPMENLTAQQEKKLIERMERMNYRKVLV